MRPFRFPPRSRGARRRGGRWLTGLLIGLALTAGALLWLNSQLRPMLLAASERTLARRAAEITAGVLAEEPVAYHELVELQYGPDGTLTALTTHPETANRLLAELTERLLGAFAALEDETVSIPSGSLTGLAILAGHGVDLPVQVRGVSGVESRWDSSLTSAGINQTVHRIDLVVEAEMDLLLPGGPYRHTVTARVTVAETVLLGEVPEYYTYFSQFDSAAEAADAYADYGAGKGY